MCHEATKTCRVRDWGLGISLAALTVGCSTSAQGPKTQNPVDVVATVGTTTITLAQVDEVALQQPAATFGNMKLSQAIYQARRAALDELVGGVLIGQEAT